MKFLVNIVVEKKVEGKKLTGPDWRHNIPVCEGHPQQRFQKSFK